MAEKRRYLPKGRVRAARQKTGLKFHVPAHVARDLPPGAVYEVEIVADGVLFRYVEGGEPRDLPSWTVRS